MGSDRYGRLAELSNELSDFRRQGRYDDAAAVSDELLALVRPLIDDHDALVASSLNSLAQFYQATGDFRAAAFFYQRALASWRSVYGDEHPDVSVGLTNLGMLLKEMGDLAAAEPLLREALAVARRTRGEGHPDVADCLNALALLYFDTGRHREAEPLLHQALSIIQRALGDRHPNVASAMNNLAAHYRATGDLARAEPLVYQALVLREQVLPRDHPDIAASRHNLASLCVDLNSYSAAEELFQKALELWRRVLGDHHPNVATALNSLGMLYRDMGRYADAERLLRESLAIRREVLGADHPQVASTLNNLASVYQDIGDYVAAASLFQDAIAIAQQALGPDHPELAKSLNNLAVLYLDRGDYDAAEPLLESADVIFRRVLGNQHPLVAVTLANLAEVRKARGDLAGAETALRLSWDTWRQAKLEEDPRAIGTIHSLATLLEEAGDYATAEPLYEQALELGGRVLGEDHHRVAIILNSLAMLMIVTGRSDEGLRLVQYVAQVDDRMVGQVSSIGSERQRMAYLDMLQGHYAQFLSLVLLQFTGQPAAVQAALDLVLRRKALGAEVLAAQRDAILGGAYPHLTPRLEELTDLRRQLAASTLAGPGTEDPDAYRERLAHGREHLERLEAELARQIPELNLEGRLRVADRNAVASALPAGSALVEFVRCPIYDATAVPARGDRRWKPERYLAFVLPAGSPEAVQLLDLGEAAPLDALIAAFRRSITGDADGRPVRGLGALPSSAQHRPPSEALRGALAELIDAVFAQHRRLFIAADSDFTRLPFEALPDASGRPLIESYQISYLSVGRDALRFDAPHTSLATPPIVAADPAFNLADGIAASAAGDGPAVLRRGLERIVRHGIVPAETLTAATEVISNDETLHETDRQSRELRTASIRFERLPGTRGEGEAIAALLGVTAWLSEAVLEGRLKECHSPRILHLATHGFHLADQRRDFGASTRGLGAVLPLSDGATARFLGADLENPLLRSGLALAGANTWCRGGTLPPQAEDGILTAEDVSGLDLAATELVVLSACETGLGDVRSGEGVFGLRRAFVLAGARTLVVSLWKVPDEQTKNLMTTFYRYLLAGWPRSEALRMAQLALKTQDPDPNAWAGFICIGDPGPLSDGE